jgi:hypothetical protein
MMPSYHMISNVDILLLMITISVTDHLEILRMQSNESSTITTFFSRKREQVFVIGVIHKWRQGSRGQGFFDNSTKPLVIKSITIGGVKNNPNLRDVIYRRPLYAFPACLRRLRGLKTSRKNLNINHYFYYQHCI